MAPCERLHPLPMRTLKPTRRFGMEALPIHVSPRTAGSTAAEEGDFAVAKPDPDELVAELLGVPEPFRWQRRQLSIEAPSEAGEETGAWSFAPRRRGMRMMTTVALATGLMEVRR